MADEIKNETINEPSETKDDAPQISLEEELARLRAENKKLKAVSDKNASEASDYKKKWRASLSEAELTANERAEQQKAMEEELANYRKKDKIGAMKDSYLKMGYDTDFAGRMAEALYENDTDALIQLQSQAMAKMMADTKTNLMKSMPAPPISQTGETTITKEQFDKMTFTELVDLKNKYPEVYKKLSDF